MPAVHNPWDGTIVEIIEDTSLESASTRIDAAAAAFSTTRGFPACRKREILDQVARRIASESETWAERITRECGKPIREARLEVDRAARLLSVCGDLARGREEAIVPLDSDPRTIDRIGWIRRRPIGAVAAITPFNFPLNLLAHKVAPAIAAGCPVIAKPSERTPLSALALRDAFVQAGWPSEAFCVLTPREPVSTVAMLARHPDVAMVSFTGSDRHGREVAALSTGKRVVLELGGNAAVAVMDDADLDWAAQRCTSGGFAFSGQVCISVQRIAVQARVLEPFLSRFLHRVATLRTGNPMDDSTDIGPMIDEVAVRRIDDWVREATEGGARILAGGEHHGRRLFAPTVLSGTQRFMKVCSEEVFGPVVVVEAFETEDEILDWMDDTRFGLQAGVFTKDFQRVWRFAERLDVGGLVVDDVPTFRSDVLPYGGERASGYGREGATATFDACHRDQVVVLRTSAGTSQP